MKNTQYYMQKHSNESLKAVAEQLGKEFSKDLFSPQLVINHLETVGDTEVLLLIFEKYYLRNSSMASVTVHCTAHDGLQKALIVASGGGEGIFNISLGANNDFATQAAYALKEFGFNLVDTASCDK